VSEWSETKIAPNLKLKSHVSIKTKAEEREKWPIHISFYLFDKEDKKVENLGWNIPYKISEKSSNWIYKFEDIEHLITVAFKKTEASQNSGIFISMDEDEKDKQKSYEVLAKKIVETVEKDLEHGKKIIKELIVSRKIPKDWNEKLKEQLDQSYLEDSNEFPSLD
jgi:hypothetical protein